MQERIRPYMFSFPYDATVQGAPMAGFYPANVRGITIDLANRKTNTPGGWDGSSTQVESLPPEKETGPIRSAVIVTDTDCIGYIAGSRHGFYLPGGTPFGLELDGADSIFIEPSMDGENEIVSPLSVGFGVLAYFSNMPVPPQMPSPFPLWFQRTVMEGDVQAVEKATALGTPDSWHALVMAPVFRETPFMGANLYSVPDANLFTSWDMGLRTSHLGPKTIAVATIGNPVVVRVQGLLPKGRDFTGVIVDDPCTGGGILIPENGRVTLRTDRQYGMMRVLVALPSYLPAAAAAGVGIEFAARFAAGA